MGLGGELPSRSNPVDPSGRVAPPPVTVSWGLLASGDGIDADPPAVSLDASGLSLDLSPSLQVTGGWSASRSMQALASSAGMIQVRTQFLYIGFLKMGSAISENNNALSCRMNATLLLFATYRAEITPNWGKRGNQDAVQMEWHEARLWFLSEVRLTGNAVRLCDPSIFAISLLK